MQRLFYFAIGLLLFAACEKTIELDLDQTETVVIIEGLLTDDPGHNQVLLSQNQPFNADGPPAPIRNARVAVLAENGLVHPYAETAPGKYRPEVPFAGEPGSSYTLTVTIDDEVYSATEVMHPIQDFNQLTYRIDEEEAADPAEEGRYYEVLVFLDEPQETEDYYLARFYRNGELLNDDGAFVFVFDDTALAPEINALPIPYYFAEADTARVEVFSLTPRAYRFYIDLAGNIGNDGGMFSGQPANVSTNLSGGALGYFQVSALTVGELQVK